MLYLTVMQAAFGGICILLFSDFNFPSASSVPLVFIIGVAGLLAHFCLTTALSLAPASVVMPIDFFRLPVLAFVGMLFYAEPFSLLIFAGAVLIFGANYLNLVYSQQR
jgi:drug/metabolite transporter (DMT)-like permease